MLSYSLLYHSWLKSKQQLVTLGMFSLLEKTNQFRNGEKRRVKIPGHTRKKKLVYEVTTTV